MKKQVVIAVLGGVAYVEYASDDVEVTIADMDNDSSVVLEDIIKQVKAQEGI